VNDAVGELIAEYAAATARGKRPEVQRARAAVTEARAALKASEDRVKRAKEDAGMKRAGLRHAVERLTALEAA